MLYCVQLVVLERLVMFFGHAKEVAQANLAQGSAPPLTPTCHYLLYNLVTSCLTCIIKEQRHQPIKNISYLGLTEKILNS